MKEKSIDLIVSISQECAFLANSLCETLEKERSGLICFDIERITQSTIEKSFLVKQLVLKRKELNKFMGALDSFSVIDQQLLKEAQEKWEELYEKVFLKCQSNQGLLKHSLRNVDLLLGNLKTLFGNPSVYDQTGKKQDLSHSGKVLEGRF